MRRFENYTAGKDYVHFVITLFNVRNFLDGTRDENEWLKWTEERIEIFKQFCLPGVRHQTIQDFKWLLYFDSGTPESILNAFRSNVHYENIEIILKNNYDDFYTSYTTDLILRTPENIEWIVQTRFDNDDILNVNAIAAIQRNVRLTDQYLISLSSGYTYQTKNGYLSHYLYSMGPFLTIVENTKHVLKGIYYCNHWQWPGLKLKVWSEFLKILGKPGSKVHFVLDPPLWIQMIHGSNMHNTSDRGFPVLRRRNLSGFNVELKVCESPISRIRGHMHYVWWKRYFKAKVVLFIRKVLFYREY